MSYLDALRGLRELPSGLQEAIAAFKRRYITGEFQAARPDLSPYGGEARDWAGLNSRLEYPQQMDMGVHPDEAAYRTGEGIADMMHGKIMRDVQDLPMSAEAPDYLRENASLYGELEQELAAKQQQLDAFYGRGAGIPRPSLNASLPLAALAAGRYGRRGIYDSALEAQRAAYERQQAMKTPRALEDLLFAMDIPGNLLFTGLQGLAASKPVPPDPVYSIGNYRK